MLKMLFFVASFFTVNNADNLRGRELTSFLDENDEWKQFTHFQDRFSKKYENIEELQTRFQIFRHNLRDIVIHNLDQTQNFTMGVNQFTDLTPEEFKSQWVGGLKTQVGSYGCKTFTSGASGAPATVDWRNKGAVTSVKDQGQCGSCWTFSATGAIEGAWAISKGQLVDLSEQELVDCATGVSYGSHGCNGGQMEGAFKFVIANGQCTLASGLSQDPSTPP
jgi:C1A family cysteine protease